MKTPYHAQYSFVSVSHARQTGLKSTKTITLDNTFGGWLDKDIEELRFLVFKKITIPVAVYKNNLLNHNSQKSQDLSKLLDIFL